MLSEYMHSNNDHYIVIVTHNETVSNRSNNESYRTQGSVLVLVFVVAHFHSGEFHLKYLNVLVVCNLYPKIVTNINCETVDQTVQIG
jgi:hypothetical protein